MAHTGLFALVLLVASLLILFPDSGYARRAANGNVTVLTNVPSESETQGGWSKASLDASAGSIPGGPYSRTAIRRLNPYMVKEAKIKMQLEANSEPLRPASIKGAIASGPVRPNPAPGNGPATGELITYSQLPTQIRDSIPLAMTMLVYSKRAEKRSITVNNWRLLEGHEVSPGLKVEEITSEGALFSYQGYRFHKKVVGD